MSAILSESFKKLSRAVFTISILDSPPTSQGEQFKIVGTCISVDPTGIFITSKKNLTNEKGEIEGLDKIYLTAFSGYQSDGKYKMISSTIHRVTLVEDYDVAFIQGDIGIFPYQDLEMEIPDLNEGDFIACAGFPLRDDTDRHIRPNLFSGVISRVDLKYFDKLKLWRKEKYILDIGTHTGNSGSPVFTHEGKIIGILSEQKTRNLKNLQNDASAPDIQTWTNLVDCTPISVFVNSFLNFKESLDL